MEATNVPQPLNTSTASYFELGRLHVCQAFLTVDWGVILSRTFCQNFVAQLLFDIRDRVASRGLGEPTYCQWIFQGKLAKQYELTLLPVGVQSCAILAVESSIGAASSIVLPTITSP